MANGPDEHLPAEMDNEESSTAPALENPFTGDEFTAAFNEPLENTLDLDTWQPGGNLLELYERLRQEVAEAVKQESLIHREIREQIFPLLHTREGAPACAGVYRVTPEQLAEVHRKLLFNGGVDGCDGTVVTHDTLPVTITQVGVCLVSYRGDQGSWVHRLFRRDLRASGRNPVEETMLLLEKRRQRSAVDYPTDALSSMARRGIMAYAERAVLLDRSNAVWRMGHGSPTPYELVTGSGMVQLVRAGIKLMRRLVLDHQRFVYVPSTTKARELLTIGNALEPLEYAIVDTNEENLRRIARGHYRGEGWREVGTDVVGFVRDCGPKIAVGMFRASRLSPCQMFYAHVDHAHEAALIAMADSVLQEHRGFPMLIDLADNFCTTTFGADTFNVSTQLAYSEAGEPFRYMAERKTRN